MLKHNAIQAALFEKVNSGKTDKETTQNLRSESELLCESIEGGLFVIGKMMEHLGCFADDKAQDFSNTALDNENVARLGFFISTNAYLLKTFRNISDNATFHLNGGYKGGAK